MSADQRRLTDFFRPHASTAADLPANAPAPPTSLSSELSRELQQDDFDTQDFEAMDAIMDDPGSDVDEATQSPPPEPTMADRWANAQLSMPVSTNLSHDRVAPGDRWDDMHVRMPHSPHNTFKDHDGSSRPKWSLISSALSNPVRNVHDLKV